jgi:hypothetical protein
MSVAAVITADIVNSTLLATQQEKKLVSQISAVLKDHKFEFYRGDSFQIYCKDASRAYELVLHIRTIARSFSMIHDVRTSIGIGKVKTPVRMLRTATSEAFILSGRAFDKLKNNSERTQITSGNEKANTPLRIIAYYTDYLFTQLTPKQAAVVVVLLRGETQLQAAKKLKKAPATINQHAQSAGWLEMEKLVTAYKQVITQFNLV